MKKIIIALGLIVILASLTTTVLGATESKTLPKYNTPPKCQEHQTKCTGQVYRVCVAGNWLKKAICPATQQCATDKGCVVANYQPKGLSETHKSGEMSKKGRILLEKGKSERKVKRTPEMTQREQTRWKISVGKPQAQKTGYEKAMVPEVTKEAENVDSSKNTPQ